MCLKLCLAAVQVDEDKEAKKVAAARDMLEGRRQHFAEGEDDPFDGLSPQQIQQVMDSQRAALDAQRESERQAQRAASASDDPFDVRLGVQSSCAALGTAMPASGERMPAVLPVGTALLVMFVLCRARLCLMQTLFTMVLQGLTPEEINEYVAKHGMPKRYQ